MSQRSKCFRTVLVFSTVACLFLVSNSASVGAVVAIQNSADLDLSGNFEYAVNFGPTTVASPINVDGLDFNLVSASGGGVTITPDPIRSFLGTEGFFSIAPALGGDADINAVLAPFIDGDDLAAPDDPLPIDLDLAVTSGQAYKLQLLFIEEFFDIGRPGGPGFRVMDVDVEGALVADDLDPYKVAVTDSGLAEGAGAAVVTHVFTAGDNNLDVTLTASESFAVISGLTLEIVPEPSTCILSLIGLTGLFCRARTK